MAGTRIILLPRRPIPSQRKFPFAALSTGGNMYSQSVLASNAAVASLRRSTGKNILSAPAHAIAAINRATGKLLLAFAVKQNYCTNFNANPTNTTNVVVAGTGSSVAIVSDAAALAAAGLDGICTSGMVYQVTAGGGVAATFVPGGLNPVAGANVIGSAYVRGGTGSVGRNGSGSSDTVFTASGVYQRISSAGFNLGVGMRITIDIGGVVYIILNQLEIGAVATSPIVVAGASARFLPAALSRQTGKSLIASSSAAATLAHQAGKILLAASPSVARLVRQTGKVIVGASSTVASLVRSTGKILSASNLGSATVTTGGSGHGQSVNASTAPVASLSRSTANLLSLNASSAAVASMIRQAGKACLATAGGVATMIRQTGKALLASSAPVALLSSLKVKLVSLLAASAAVARLVRTAGVPLQASASPIANLARRAGKALVASSAPVAGLIRQTAKTLRASDAAAASLSSGASATVVLLAHTAARASLSTGIPQVIINRAKLLGTRIVAALQGAKVPTNLTGTKTPIDLLGEVDE